MTDEKEKIRRGKNINENLFNQIFCFLFTILGNHIPKQSKGRIDRQLTPLP